MAFTRVTRFMSKRTKSEKNVCGVNKYAFRVSFSPNLSRVCRGFCATSNDSWDSKIFKVDLV